MTNEEKEVVLHCLRSMIDEELCEECPLYGTTGTDLCEKDCVRLAIEELEQEPCEDCIRRQAVFDITWEEPSYTDAMNVLTEVRDKVKELPSVNPQKPCKDCKLKGDTICLQ